MKVNLSTLKDQPKPREPSRRKRGLLASCGVLLFAGTLVIGGIMAYQTKSEDLGNIFLIGEVMIAASEPAFPTEDTPEGGRVDGVPDDCELMIPYETIPKDPSIRNIGKNDCVVFFRVTVPVETVTIIKDDGTSIKDVDEDLFWMKTADTSDDTHENHFNPNWIQITSLDGNIVDCEGVNDEGKGKTYIFGWHQKLAVGASTETLFDKVQNKKYGSRTIRADEPEQIKIESFAIQSEYIKRNGIDVPSDGEFTEEDLTYIYKVFVNQNEETVGKGGWTD